jgi:hypothetical protein
MSMASARFVFLPEDNALPAAVKTHWEKLCEVDHPGGGVFFCFRRNSW